MLTSCIPRTRFKASTRVALWLLTAAIVACSFVSQTTLRRGDPRFVIIHSDDAGMCPSVNRATIDAMERSSVSSCSILVPCPAFAEFATYARNHPEKDFGVHLDLNCELQSQPWGPVSPVVTVPSLVDSQGHFWRYPRDTVRNAKINEVERELRAQIDKAIATGIRVSHLNHHMFILYRRPDFLRLYIRLGLEYGLPLRLAEEVPWNEFDDSDAECIAGYQEAVTLLRNRGFPLATAIDTDNYSISPHHKRDYYLTLLTRLKPGVTEVVVHCAYLLPNMVQAPAAERRAADARVFISTEFSDALTRNGVHLINWTQFSKMTSAGFRGS
jgi:predicted glycoside hydrolase/deacetylase ChbG (UPF0249 family)